MYHSFLSLNLILVTAMSGRYLSSFQRQENYWMAIGTYYSARSLVPKPEPFHNSGWLSEMFFSQRLLGIRNGGGRDPRDILTQLSFHMYTSAGVRPDKRLQGKEMGLGSSRSMGESVFIQNEGDTNKGASKFVLPPPELLTILTT